MPFFFTLKCLSNKQQKKIIILYFIDTLKGFFKKTGPYICASLNAHGGSHFDTWKWNWSVLPDFNSTVCNPIPVGHFKYFSCLGVLTEQNPCINATIQMKPSKRNVAVPSHFSFWKVKHSPALALCPLPSYKPHPSRTFQHLVSVHLWRIPPANQKAEIMKAIRKTLLTSHYHGEWHGYHKHHFSK